MKRKDDSLINKGSFWALLIFLSCGVVFSALIAYSIAASILWAQWLFFALLCLTLLSGLIFAICLYARMSKNEGDAVTSFTQQLASSKGGVIPLLSLDERRMSRFLPLQEAINSFLDDYSRFEIIYSKTSQDKNLRNQIALGHVFREDEFKKNLYFELQSSLNFRSALLLFSLISKKEDRGDDKEALLKAIRKAFPEAMLGEREDGFSCFVYSVGALLPLQSCCQKMVRNFATLDLDVGENVSYCKMGGVIYPFASMSEIYQEAEKALSESDGVNLISTFPSFRFPRTILTENNKLVVYQGFLETAKAHYSSLHSRAEKVSFLSSLFVWASSTLGLKSGGYLSYDSSALEYRVEVDVGRDGENLTFGKLGNRIPTTVIDPFYERASEDLFFAVENVDDLPPEYASPLKNLGIASIFLRSLGKSGKRSSLVFLCGDKKAKFDSLVSHTLLDALSTMVSEAIVEMQEEQRSLGAIRVIDALASRTHRYLYTIDRSSHRLSFVSTDLAKAYPEAKPGALCYEALGRGKDGPCSYCPLVRGSTSRLFQELSSSPCSYSVLEYRGEDSDRSTLLLEPQNVDSTSFKVSRLMDEAFMIRNQQALALVINRDCKNRNPGYVLATRINNFPALIQALPESDITSLMGQVVKNFQDAGYEELLYRFDESTLAFVLPNYTKTKAISFAEEAAEILSMPLEAGNVAKQASVSYGLIAYPGDVSNARQLVTLVQNDMNRSRDIGDGYLVDQSGAQPRKAKRSDFITSLLQEAVSKDLLKAFLQPIVDAKTLRPTTGDIRAALYAPDKTEVAPAEFIPLAEKAGLVSKIDVSSFHALGELFSQYGYTVFKNVGVSHLAIYLSLNSLMDESFPSQVKRTFSQYHFPVGCVQFVIKMSYLAKNAEAVKKLQDALSSISIEWIASEFDYERDDLSTLNAFSIKTVKTDRLIVSNALSSPRDGTAFARFCSDAQKAGVRIIATGIETEEQSKFASHLGVFAMEGYYFGRPMSEEQFINFVAYGSDPTRRKAA